MGNVAELNTTEIPVGVPRCLVCNRLYRKSDVNEHGLCPKCLTEKVGAPETGEAGVVAVNNQSKQKEVVEEIKVGPGRAIRDAFSRLVIDGKVTDSVLSILTDSEATARELGIRYAFLKEFNPDVPIKELTYVKSHARYSSKPIVVNDKQYLVTNDLYSKNVSRFIKWADNIGQN